MCGRFSLTTPGPILAEMFGVVDLALPPRFNVAPTQSVPVVRVVDGQRVIALLRWGLVPSWSKDPKKGPPLINARADTVAEKPAFRAALKYRRCIVPADGFFEWKKEGAKRLPVHFKLRDGRPFGFAGLWECWKSPEGEILESMTILTTTPNELVAAVHDRMPAILPPSGYDAWLNPSIKDAAAVIGLLGPYSEALMVAVPVSEHVNKVANDDPKCHEPLPTLGLK